MDHRIERQLNALDEALVKLEKSLSGYTADQLNRKPAPDQWSVMQVVNHMWMAEAGSLNYLRKKLTQPEVIGRAGFGSVFRTWALWVSQNIPFLKFKAPAAISGEKLPAVSDREAVFAQWRTSRQELRAFLEALPADIFVKEAYRHPRAGRMTLGQMLAFFVMHFDRHAGQIRRTLNAR